MSATKKIDTKAVLAALATITAFVNASGSAEAAPSKKEAPSVSVPTPAAVAKLDKAGLKKAAADLGIDTDGLKIAEIKSLLVTFGAIVHDTEDEVSPEEINALAAALGVTPDKKPAKTVAAIKKFGESLSKTEEVEEEAAEEDAEEEADADDAEEDDDDDSEEDDAEEADDEDEEEEKPAKKTSKKASKKDEDEDEAEEDDAEEDDAEESDDDDDDDSDEESEEDDAEEESDDDDEEEVSEKEWKARLASYNEHAKKPLKNVASLQKLLGDNKWGTPYIHGEGDDAEGYCCGIPLTETSDESTGKCAITEKCFSFDGEDFEEVDEPAAKKPAKKVKK